MNDLELLVKATEFAAEKHKNQRRKDADKTPYINHPIEVAAELTRAGITDVSVLIAALLHDTVEDTNTTFSELETVFGSHVAGIVGECTDDKGLQKVQRKKFQIIHSGEISKSGKLVKLADKYSNMKGLYINPPAKWSKEVIKGYAYWSYAVVKEMKNTNEILERKLDEEFLKFGIAVHSITDSELNEQLELYYDIIKDAE